MNDYRGFDDGRGGLDSWADSTDERLDRIEAIMRANNMHEPGCAGPVAPYQVLLDPSLLACDCWLSR